jgi:NADPH:quinone reductase-like Zn-dependent oxidoreductase
MYAAQVTNFGKPPVYTEVPALPAPSTSQIQLKVLTSGLHQVVRSRASGQHYSAKSAALPMTVGIDGVGEEVSPSTLSGTGNKFYFATFGAGAGGSMAGSVNVDRKSCVPLPEGADDVAIAALVNPALSSWMSFTKRADNLRQGFTVLIVGATSASGKLAITLARALGAGKVIGAARNKAAMEELGLNEMIVTNSDDPEATDFSKLGDVDLILDYVYGSLTAHLLSSLKSKVPTQYVHIGGLSGELDLSLPGAVLRSNNLTIRGSGPGSYGLAEAVGEMPRLLEELKGFGREGIRIAKLEDVEKEWENREGGKRVVFVP